MPSIQLTKPNEQQTRWSLFLGITIWFISMLMLDALTSVACEWGWFTFPIAGLSGLQFVEAIITLLVSLVMLFLIYLPWREWRQFQTERPLSNPHLLHDTEVNHRRLIAFIAMVLNGFFFMFGLITFVPIFTLKACGQA